MAGTVQAVVIVGVNLRSRFPLESDPKKELSLSHTSSLSLLTPCPGAPSALAVSHTGFGRLEPPWTSLVLAA